MTAASECPGDQLGLECHMCSLMTLPAQGKFIWIHFGATGKLAGADIKSCESGLFQRVLGGQDQLPLWGTAHSESMGPLFQKY